MEIRLNNRSEVIEGDKITLRELIELKKFTFKLIIFKINGIIIRSEDYDTTYIADGDEVHAIHMVSGG
jgi:sulfur carrier protein